MAPPAPPPSRVFAELDPAASPVPEGRLGPPVLPEREVHVSGSAELSARPDRARVSLRLGSRKEAAAAARSSVSRRLQYIAHTARLRGVPEENMTVTEDFSRIENTYQMEAEVCITFSDFGKMQNVCNLLIEKLGASITISPPHFYHTPEAIDTLRVTWRWTQQEKPGALTGSWPLLPSCSSRTVTAKDLQTPSWDASVGHGAEERLWRGPRAWRCRDRDQGSTKSASQWEPSPLPWCTGAPAQS
ncbi:interleukin-1 receptor-associated kinase 1-binding protein 1 isoform X3 [Prinia subflava]|uniref:interleukin-1 receptor-associated kinase 1-binding protein 1 isoform X3 n=1 Tax=Prinia subflava TaxID=208062 RepID=UPI002FE05301